MKFKERIHHLNKYGTSINIKQFLLECLFIIGSIVGIAYLLKLRGFYFYFVVGESLLLIPFIVLAYAKQIRSFKKFHLLTDYLSNALPIFLQRSKILYTLQELSFISSDEMKRKIDEAITYLQSEKKDADALSNALCIIEKEFPNTRIKSLHKFLVDVENNNSLSYQDVANHLYEDIEGWIKRTFLYQKELKNKRNKLIILCILTLLMDGLFLAVYGANEYFIGFSDNPIYQLFTTIFISSIEIMVVAILSKLNGTWLVDDMGHHDEKIEIKQYHCLEKGKPKFKVVDIVLLLAALISGVYFYYLSNIRMAISFVLIAVVIVLSKSRRFYRARKNINRLFQMEFPMWLREVSLSLGTQTVLNAINQTQSLVSYPLRKEIRKFLKQAYQNPTSIQPYNDFLMDYDLEDARSSMRVLYAINNVSKEDMNKRVSLLIRRNQEMLAKSESIQNEDEIGLFEALGYLPLLLFALQAMASMFLMFAYMIERLSLEALV